MKSRAVLLGIIALAFGLRLIALDTRPVWYDEAFAVLYASRSFDEMIAGTLSQVGSAAADVHPLFYYFSLHAWMGVVGNCAFAARFFSVVFGIVTIPIVYHIARALFDQRVALATALVIALAPFHIAYSQEARMYAQLGFWSALALWAFVRFWRTAHKRGWIVFVLAGAGALYSHNLAFAIFAALGAWVIFDALKTRTTRLLRATAFAGLAMLALWLPWLIFVPSQFGKIAQAYWVPPPTIVTFVQTLLVFTFDFDNAAPPRVLFPVLLFGALFVAALVAFEIARRARTLEQPSRAALTFAITLAIAPIVLLFAISQWRSVYIIRALMPSFLWFAVLVGWMLAKMPRGISNVVALGLGALVIALLPAYFTYADFPRAPFKQVVQELRVRAHPTDAVVHDNKLSFFPMHYYDRTFAQAFVADPPGAGSDTLAYPTQQALQLYATDLKAATLNKSRVWFLIFQRALDEAAEQGHAHSNLVWMEQHFHPVSRERFNDLNVYLFER
jgi:uncharacterized membrane protein